MAEQWFVAVQTPQGPQRTGPIPLEQVRQMAQNGQLRPQDLVWKEGTPDWLPAGHVPEIFGGIQAGAPGMPPGYGGPPPSDVAPVVAGAAVGTVWIILGVVAVVGFLAAMCCVVSLAAITTIGTNSSQTFSKIGSSINTTPKN